MLLKIPDVLSREELAKLRMELGRTQLQDGTVTGKKGLKQNLQSDQVSQQLPQLLQTVTNALMRTDGFTMYALPRKLHLVFNRYDVGMHYGEHIDAALIGPSQDRAVRSDVSFSLFPSDPATYEGGDGRVGEAGAGSGEHGRGLREEGAGQTAPSCLTR